MTTFRLLVVAESNGKTNLPRASRRSRAYSWAVLTTAEEVPDSLPDPTGFKPLAVVDDEAFSPFPLALPPPTPIRLLNQVVIRPRDRSEIGRAGDDCEGFGLGAVSSTDAAAAPTVAAASDED